MRSPTRATRARVRPAMRRSRALAICAAAFALASCGSDSASPTPVAARIVFTSESALIGLRGSATLTPIVLDADDNLLVANDLKWTSSDPAIAPVSDAGVVNGVALGGPVTITARLDEISATIVVRVVPGQVVISPSITTLVVGTTAQLSAQVFDALGDPIPGLPVTWTNSTPGVASLDPSTLVLTGLTSGNAYVSATAGGRESAIGVLVGVPSALDGLYTSDPAASTYAEVEVTFGKVTRFFATFRPMATCSVSVNAAPNIEITGTPPAAGQFAFAGAGSTFNNISGSFSTLTTVNGFISNIPLASTSCGPTVGSVFASYAAARL